MNSKYGIKIGVGVGVGVGIGIGIEGQKMGFGHEKLEHVPPWSAAYIDLQVCGALSPEGNATRKALLDRIVAMLTKLG
jgi:hypothetical protein